MIDIVAYGPFACFTQPETRTDRISYPVITPSAAKGLLRSIFWKPAIQWMPREIQILKPVQYHSQQTAELEKAAKPSNPSPNSAYRTTEGLRDVAYRIKADVKLVSYGRDENKAKYFAQFRRRVSRGQFFDSPYLGMREFPAFIREPRGDDAPIDFNLRQRMFLGWDYERAYSKGHTDGFDGEATARFFTVKIEDGVYRVPRDLYDQIT
jgi:CRISPR-associated protein Cas5d